MPNCRVTYNTGDNPETLRYEVHFKLSGEWTLMGWSSNRAYNELFNLGCYGNVEEVRVIDTHETKPIGGEE